MWLKETLSDQCKNFSEQCTVLMPGLCVVQRNQEMDLPCSNVCCLKLVFCADFCNVKPSVIRFHFRRLKSTRNQNVIPFTFLMHICVIPTPSLQPFWHKMPTFHNPVLADPICHIMEAKWVLSFMLTLGMTVLYNQLFQELIGWLQPVSIKSVNAPWANSCLIKISFLPPWGNQSGGHLRPSARINREAFKTSDHLWFGT